MVTGLTRDNDVEIKISPFFTFLVELSFLHLIAMCLGIVVLSIQVFVKISGSY